ncbi:MAG: glycosyltransferase family 39 protein, partial [Candidatus Brocadiia bacterium]
NGESRLQKTPLSYWLVAPLAKVTGQVDEFTARVPSALSGVLSVAAILYFLSRMFSFRISAMSACVWATSLAYIRYSHNARPEMLLTFFTILSMLSFYAGINETDRKRQVIYLLIFWSSFGLGMLAKGPTPLPLVALPLFCYCVIYRKWNMIPKLLPIIGTIIFLAIVLPWPIAIAEKVNWDLTQWKKEFIDRFFGEFDSGSKPAYYYFPILFLFTAPWSAFVPMALIAPFYKIWKEKRDSMMYLFLWFAAGFVFFTINGGKRQHYILPNLPAMAILIGVILNDLAFERKAYTFDFAKRVLKTHIVVIILLAIAAPIVLLVLGSKGQIHPEKTNAYFMICAVVLGSVTIVLSLLIGKLFARHKPGYAFICIIAGITIFIMLSYVTLTDPGDDQYSRYFSKKLATIVPPQDKLAAYPNASKPSVQYFGRVIPEESDIEKLYRDYLTGEWVMATGQFFEKLQADGRFKLVYFKKKAERQKSFDVPGGLFHVSTDKMEYEK